MLKIKKKLLIIFILILAFSIFTIYPFILYWIRTTYYYKFKPQNICDFKEEGYSICCLNAFGEKFACEEKGTFECGENISILVTLKNLSLPAYICAENYLIPTNFSCFTLDSLPAYLIVEGKISQEVGEQTFLEIYNFNESYNSIEEYKKNLENSELILLVARNVKC